MYFAARRGENGEEPALTRWLRKYQSLNEVWLERNTLHSQAVQQAAADKLLFLTAPRSTNYELRFPEYVTPAYILIPSVTLSGVVVYGTFLTSFRIIQSHSPRNVVAGSLINIDAVTERYRKQHYEEEERKAKKLAAKQQAEAAEKA